MTEPTYRVIRRTNRDGEQYCAVHAVYLDGVDEIFAYDGVPVLGYGETPYDLRRLAIRAAMACKEPVLEL